MLNESFLLDNFLASGKKEDDFEELVKEIDRHTLNLKRCIRNFIVISLKPEHLQKDPECLRGWHLDPLNPSNNGALKECAIPKSGNLKNKRFDVLVLETIGKNSTMLYDREGNCCWFLSDFATSTMAQRVGITKGAIQQHSVERDLFLARKMNADEETTLVVKQYQQIGKIFAMMGGNYKHIPLYEMCVIYKDIMGENKLGAMECEGWNITHEKATISFAFRDYAEEINVLYGLKRQIVPCVEMTTSDIGESSFTVRGYWKTPDGAIVYDNTVALEHRGKINQEKIETAVSKRIFDQYTKLPEKLAQLMEIDLTPFGLDLNGARNSGRNHKAICSVFSKAFKQMRLVDVIGKKRLTSLERYIDWTLIQDTMHYTAYDIIMDIFSLTETMKTYFENENMKPELIRKFREKTSTAAYDVNFSEIFQDISNMSLTS